MVDRPAPVWTLDEVIFQAYRQRSLDDAVSRVFATRRFVPYAPWEKPRVLARRAKRDLGGNIRVPIYPTPSRPSHM